MRRLVLFTLTVSGGAFEVDPCILTLIKHNFYIRVIKAAGTAVMCLSLLQIKLFSISSWWLQSFPAAVEQRHHGSHLVFFRALFQECDDGYTRTTSGLYLGMCERCNCNGHSSSCDPETGRCLVGSVLLFIASEPFICAFISVLECAEDFWAHPNMYGVRLFQISHHLFLCLCFLKQCLHHTTGDRCENCLSGFYGDPVRGQPCQPCPCPGLSPSNQYVHT